MCKLNQKIDMHLAHRSDLHTAASKLLFWFAYITWKPIVEKKNSLYIWLKKHDFGRLGEVTWIPRNTDIFKSLKIYLSR